MKDLKDMLADQRIFRDLNPKYIDLIVGCASNVRYNQGDFVFRQGDPANNFFLVRHGRVALELFVPNRGAVIIQTVTEGDVLGWSWLFPPYERYYDARAIVLTRAIAFDAKCLREKCDEDNELGYELMKRFAQVMVNRLQAARVQLLDVYGHTTGT
jgi:CRP/FNR family cyclic AMP-dependent transcriptional regulator